MRGYKLYLLFSLLLVGITTQIQPRGSRGYRGGYRGGYRHGYYRGGWGYGYRPYWGWGYPYWGAPYYDPYYPATFGITLGADLSGSGKSRRSYDQGYDDATRHEQLKTERDRLKEENEELRVKKQK